MSNTAASTGDSLVKGVITSREHTGGCDTITGTYAMLPEA